MEWNDVVILNFIDGWFNIKLGFPINQVNVQLWKHQLETNEDLLLDYNSWNVHIERQQHVCKKHLSNWNPINKNWKIRCGPGLLIIPFTARDIHRNTDKQDGIFGLEILRNRIIFSHR